MRLNELIARLEQATQGDPALDFWVWWWSEESGPRGDEPAEIFADERILSAAAPHYSTDLDLAASLVPEGYQWRLEEQDGRYVASVSRPVSDLRAHVVQARDAALALCAAALRCRMAYIHEVMRGRQ